MNSGQDETSLLSLLDTASLLLQNHETTEQAAMEAVLGLDNNKQSDHLSDSTLQSPSPAKPVPVVAEESVASKRTVFSRTQLKVLEERFRLQSFLSREERKELAEELGLTERQVMVWFQNRRGRLKKRGPADKAYNPTKLNELNRPYPILYGMLSHSSQSQNRTHHQLLSMYPEEVKMAVSNSASQQEDSPKSQRTNRDGIKLEQPPPNVVVCPTREAPNPHQISNSLNFQPYPYRIDSTKSSCMSQEGYNVNGYSLTTCNYDVQMPNRSMSNNRSHQNVSLETVEKADQTSKQSSSNCEKNSILYRKIVHPYKRPGVISNNQEWQKGNSQQFNTAMIYPNNNYLSSIEVPYSPSKQCTSPSEVTYSSVTSIDQGHGGWSYFSAKESQNDSQSTFYNTKNSYGPCNQSYSQQLGIQIAPCDAAKCVDNYSSYRQPNIGMNNGLLMTAPPCNRNNNMVQPQLHGHPSCQYA